MEKIRKQTEDPLKRELGNPEKNTAGKNPKGN
jgi:hypothetical protein